MGKNGLVLCSFLAGFFGVISMSEDLHDLRCYCRAVVAGFGAAGLLKTPPPDGRAGRPVDLGEAK